MTEKKPKCSICQIRDASKNSSMCADCKGKTDKLIGDIKKKNPKPPKR